MSMKLMSKRTRGRCPVSRREGLVAHTWLHSVRKPEAFWQTWGSTRPRCCPSCGQILGVSVGPVLPKGLRETTFKEYCTGLGKQTLRGHKQNLVYTSTQEKGAVTPQETDPDLPVCPRVSSRGMGFQHPAVGVGSLSVAMSAKDQVSSLPPP